MAVAPCPLPTDTALDRELVERAFFTDSYQVSLTHSSATVVDIFFAVFGHHPLWLKAVLLVRHRVGAWLGLQAASTAEVMNPSRAASYRVGQHIGPWQFTSWARASLWLVETTSTLISGCQFSSTAAVNRHLQWFPRSAVPTTGSAVRISEPLHRFTSGACSAYFSEPLWRVGYERFPPLRRVPHDA
jgi:hypothetical protein